MSIRAVARDVLIIYSATFLAGFIIVRADIHDPFLWLPIVSAFIAIAAFCFAGCLTPRNRFKHLAYVALFVWLSEVPNIVFLGVDVMSWLINAGVLFAYMFVGGGLSFVIKKPHTS